jgi:hypothetical protein
MASWSVRVDDLTDIYCETRVVDMLRTVDSAVIDRISNKDGSVHVSVEVPERSVAQLIREMVNIIDPHAIVSRVRPHVRAAL